MSNKTGFAPIVFILIFVAIIITILVLTLKFKPPIKVTTNPSPTPLILITSPTPSDNQLLNLTRDWKTYTNPQFKFTMKYPNEFSFKDVGLVDSTKLATSSGQVSKTFPATLDTAVFIDSNKDQFSLNIYPISTDPNVNTNVTNLYEFSGFCGTQYADRTITNKVADIAGIQYKEIIQADAKGKNLTDFCFFTPGGNLMVLRNNTGSTTVGMELIISTLQFTYPSPSPTPQVCGGIANLPCSEGYECKITDTQPDATGVCVVTE